MKGRHLERRPCRGRAIAWSRVPLHAGGELVAVDYRLFLRLAHSGATLCQTRTFLVADLASARAGARKVVADALRGMRAQLRWRRDQLELEALGLQDTTPPPLPAR